MGLLQEEEEEVEAEVEAEAEVVEFLLVEVVE